MNRGGSKGAYGGSKQMSVKERQNVCTPFCLSEGTRCSVSSGMCVFTVLPPVVLGRHSFSSDVCSIFSVCVCPVLNFN